jgi:exonuclease VII large subunit
MARKSPEKRLAELQEQQDKIEAQLKQKRERIIRQKRQQQARLTNQKRREDTRRKVLIGAAVLAQVESGRWPEGQLSALMDSFLERERDRSLFGLPTNQTNEA